MSSKTFLEMKRSSHPIALFLASFFGISGGDAGNETWRYANDKSTPNLIKIWALAIPYPSSTHTHTHICATRRSMTLFLAWKPTLWATPLILAKSFLSPENQQTLGLLICNLEEMQIRSFASLIKILQYDFSQFLCFFFVHCISVTATDCYDDHIFAWAAQSDCAHGQRIMTCQNMLSEQRKGQGENYGKHHNVWLHLSSLGVEEHQLIMSKDWLRFKESSGF